MPEEVKEALAKVAATLPPVDWLPPDRLRARARAIRRRTTVVASCLMVLFLVGGFQVGRSVFGSPTPAAPPLSCPSGVAHLKLPTPSSIKVLITVAESTWAGKTAREQLTDRGFEVLDVNVRADADGGTLAGRLRYGPAMVGPAWVLRSYLRSEVQMVFDPTDEARYVELILGPDFESIAGPTEANRFLASAGHPPAPPGTCGVD